MFQVELTSYGQTQISAQVIIEGTILLLDQIDNISSLTSISSYSTVYDDEAVGNIKGSLGNVRILDLGNTSYQAKTILFYKTVNNEKKILGGYSQGTPLIQKVNQQLNLFLSFDFSAFTHGFLFSSIQAGFSTATHNTDGLVHIEDPDIESDNQYSVYSKPQVDELLKNKDTELIRGTQTVSTASWTGNTVRNRLYEGMCINYFLPFAGKASSTLQLTLSNGNITDAIPIYFRGATAVGTHFPVGSVIQLTYMENVVIGSTTIAKGWFADSDYLDGNTTTYISTAQPLKADTNGIYGRCLVMRTGVDTWESIMLSYSNKVANHVLNTSGFYPDVIYYTGATAKINAGAFTTATHYNIYNTLSYTNYFADVTTTPLVVGKPFYFVGTFHNDGKFYFNNPTYHAQEVTTGDIYILVGLAYSTTTISLLPDHPMYTLKDGVVTQITHQSFVNSEKIDDLEDSIPTNTSDLTNDSGFITSSDIPTNVSAFNNDAGYLTSYTETDPTVPSWAKQPTKPTYTASEVGALPDSTVIPTVYDATLTIKKNSSDNGDTFTANASQNKTINLDLATVATSGSYNDLSNKPTIPTKTSELTNDAEFITEEDIPSDISAFNNDAGYLTSYTETDPTVPAWAKEQNKPSYTLDEVTDGSTRKLSDYVPKTRKVNNKALSADITLNLDDVADGSTRKLSNYVPYGEIFSTINGFDNRRQWLFEVHNVLWAATQRYDVTMSGFSTGSTTTFFDGSFETQCKVTAGNTGVITIAGKNGTKMFDGGYPYGYLEVAFYYTSIPESVSCRVYSDWSQNPGWHSFTLTNVCKNNNQALYRGQNTGFYGVTQMEITVVAKAGNDASVTEIAFYQTRGTLQQLAVFNKGIAQTLYYNLTGPKFIVTGGTSSQFMKADGSLDSNTYLTSSALAPYELSANLKEGAYVDVDETTMTSTSGNLPTGKAVASYISGLNYATVSQIPTNVSQLANDVPYLTQHQSIKTINNNSLVGTGNVQLDLGDHNVIESISVDGDAQTVTNKNVDLHIPDDIVSIETIGSFYRNNVSGTGSISKPAANCYGQFPTISVAGTYSVRVRMYSSTSTYTLNVTFGTNSYSLTSSSGIIDDTRTLTLASGAVWNGTLPGSVASNTVIRVHIYETGVVINTVGVAAVSNDYNDLDNIPTIPTATSQLTNDSGYLTQHQSLAGVVATAQYNATDKTIEFYNSSGTKLNTDIDATAFIKDGMVDNVEVSNGKLIISFNTDAGKEDIEIPLSDIFDASNYYNKTETDSEISGAITALNLGTASTKNYSTDMNTAANLPTTSAITTYISNQNFATTSQIPTKISDLTNDVDYATQSDLSGYVQKISSSTDNAIVRFDGTSGAVQNSGVTIDDSNNLLIPLGSSGTFSQNSKLVIGNAWFGSNTTGGLAYGVKSGSTYTGYYTFESTAFRPVSTSDNAIDIGTSSYRWKDLYIAGKICKNGTYKITVPSATGTMALTSDIPTNVSQLTNDANYITLSSVPTNVSQLTNDANYISTETDPTVPSWAKQPSKPTYTASEVGALPSDTSIPANTSDLNNDAGFITTSDLSPYELSANLKEGAYVDVDENTTTASSTNLTTGKSMAAYVSSQNFATVSQLPTVNNATLTIQKNGTTVNTFTANASSPVTANITVPTTVAELTDASDYVTEDDLETTVQDYLEDHQNIIVAGNNITITSSSSVLPTGYSQVEYIQSNGSSYLDTGLAPTDTTKIIVDIFNNSTGSFYVIGARASSSSTIILAQSGSSTGAVLSGTFNGTSITAKTGSTNWSRTSLGQRYVITLETNNGTGFYEIEDLTNDREFSASLSYSTIGTVSTHILLCAFNSSNVLGGTTRVYRCEIYRDDVLAFQGIPCYRNSDGIYGLYDTVSDTFITSSSSTQFTGSTEINNVLTISSKDEKAQWGKITGTLSNQIDLNTALGLKANSADLATVATSGSYNDLTNKPTIPTVNNAKLTIKKNSSDTGTEFTANASSPVTCNLGLKEGAFVDVDETTMTSSSDNLPTSKAVASYISGLGYLTTETDPTVPAWAKTPNKPTYTASEVGALPDSTTIPSATSQLTNDSGFITLSDVPAIPSKTTARSDQGYLYNGQSVDVVMDNIGFSNANNLINTSGVTAYVAIRANSNNPFLGLKEGSNLWYAQAASNKFYFGSTSSKALMLDQSGNGTFQTGTCTATGFKYKNGSTEGTSSQFLKADGSLDSNTYLTSYTETDPTVPAWAKTPNKPTYTASEVGALPSTTVIPTDTGDLTNNAGYINQIKTINNESLIGTGNITISGGQTYTAGEGIAIANNAIKTTGIPFGICDETSTSTDFTVTVPGIYKLEDGVCCLIKNGVVTSASGFTLNVNGLGAKPVYSNMAAATAETTMFNINYTMFFVYDSTRVSGGCWILYRGYYQSDTDKNAYQIRGNTHTLPTTAKFYRYRLLFTSADGTHFVPSNISTSTNATAKRDVVQTPIDPFGEIVYYSTTTAIEAEANPGPTYLWTQYAVTLGYSFNRTGSALVLTTSYPVYIKCAPQSNGSAIIDATTPYVQTLPNSADGKIYIFLGVATSATAIELLNNHPVYYHDGTGIRLWSGKDSYSKTEADSSFVTITSDQTINSNKTLQYGKKLYVGSEYSYIVGGGSSTDPNIKVYIIRPSNTALYTELILNSYGFTLTKHSGTSEEPVTTKIAELSYTLDSNKIKMWTNLLMKGSTLEFGDTANTSNLYFTIHSTDRTVNSQTVKDTSFDIRNSGRLNVCYGSYIKCYVDENGVTIPDSKTLTFNGANSNYSTSLQNDNFASTLKMTGVFAPSTTETYTLGTSSLKWSNIYSTTFTGNLTGDVTGNVTGKFSTARNINGLAFDGSADIQNFAQCTTEGNVAAKTATITGLTVSNGIDIYIHFGASNTATDPTLNINNTTAYPIYFGANKAGTTQESSWYSGEIVHFVFFTMGGGRWYAIGRSHAVFGYDTFGYNIAQGYPYNMYTAKSSGARHVVDNTSPSSTNTAMMLTMWSKTEDRKNFCGISNIIASTIWGVSATGYGDSYSNVSRTTSTSGVGKGGIGAVRQMVLYRTGTQSAMAMGTIISDGTLSYGSVSFNSQGVPTLYRDQNTTVDGTWVTLSTIPSQTATTLYLIIAVRIA